MSIQDQTSPLRRVYVRAPVREDLHAWAAYGWRSRPDPTRAVAEHEALRAELERAGASVETGSTRTEHDPDAIYAYDPTLMTDTGAVLLRPGKEGRRAEPDAVADDLSALGIGIAGRLEAPATAEGGDLFWLDRSTLLAGRSYRTNDDGIAQLRTLLGPSIDVNIFAAAGSRRARGTWCTSARRNWLPVRWAIQEAQGSACSAGGEPSSGTRIFRKASESSGMRAPVGGLSVFSVRAPCGR